MAKLEDLKVLCEEVDQPIHALINDAGQGVYGFFQDNEFNRGTGNYSIEYWCDGDPNQALPETKTCLLKGYWSRLQFFEKRAIGFSVAYISRIGYYIAI